MKQLEHRLAVAKAQVEPAHVFLGDLTALVTFHDKGGTGGKGYEVDAVGVAIKIFFQDRLWVKDTQIGTQPGDTFIFRAVNSDTLPGIGTGFEQKVVGSFGAGHRAAIPAAS